MALVCLIVLDWDCLLAFVGLSGFGAGMNLFGVELLMRCLCCCFGLVGALRCLGLGLASFGWVGLFAGFLGGGYAVIEFVKLWVCICAWFGELIFLSIGVTL